MDYKLYFLDPDGHIRQRLDLDCADDHDALRQVQEHADGRGMELWHRSRIVQRFPPAPPR